MNEDEINELHKIYDIIISGKNARRTEKEGCESVQKQYDFLFRKQSFVLSLQTGSDSYHSRTARIHPAVV